MAPITRHPKRPGPRRVPGAQRRQRRETKAAPVSSSASREQLAAEFGRHGSEREHAVATDLGCSECRGVLYVSELGKRGWLSFRCRVGHAFSADSLLAAKEEQLEGALWGTVEVLEELVQLYGVLTLRVQAKRHAPSSVELERRLSHARRHLRLLRRLIETEGPAPAALDGDRGRRVRR